jgi:hypothetical protein
MPFEVDMSLPDLRKIHQNEPPPAKGWNLVAVATGKKAWDDDGDGCKA